MAKVSPLDVSDQETLGAQSGTRQSACAVDHSIFGEVLPIMVDATDRGIGGTLLLLH